MGDLTKKPATRRTPPGAKATGGGLSAWLRRTPTRLEKIAGAGLVLFLTGMVVAALVGDFTPLSTLLCLAGLAIASLLFAPGLGRNGRLYLNMGLYSACVLATLMVFFGIVRRHPSDYDSTSSKFYSVTDVTKNFLRSRLQTPVKATAFVANAVDRKSAQLLLDEYSRYAPSLFSYEVLDPFRNVAEARRLGLQVVPGDVYIEKQTTQSAAGGAAARVVKLNRLNEEEVTNGIVALQRGRDITLYFLVGHGELSLEDNRAAVAMTGGKASFDDLTWLKSQLERSRIRVLPLDLAGRGNKVPADASAVVIVGPRRDLSSPEREGLKAYLDRGGPGGTGGRAMVFFPPGIIIGGDIGSPMRNFIELIESYGLSPAPEIITMPKSRTDQYSIPALPAAPHRINQQLLPDQPLVFTEARPIRRARLLPPNAFPEEVFTSPPDAFALPLEELTQALRTGKRMARSDIEAKQLAPRPLAASVTIQPPGAREEDSTRLVVFGTSKFLTTEAVDQNAWLVFINAVNWVTASGDAISIPAREVKNTPMELSAGQRRFLFIATVLVLPCLVGFGGLGYVLSRRENERTDDAPAAEGATASAKTAGEPRP